MTLSIEIQAMRKLLEGALLLADRHRARQAETSNAMAEAHYEEETRHLTAACEYWRWLEGRQYRVFVGIGGE